MSAINFGAMAITFRETAEVSVVVSGLLLLSKALLDQDTTFRKRANFAIAIGTALGLLFVAVLSIVIYFLIEKLGPEIWGRRGDIWEGSLALLGSVIMTAFAIGVLKIRHSSKVNTGFVQSLGQISKKPNSLVSYYPLVLLPCVTVWREGLETILFIVGLSGTAAGGVNSLIFGTLIGLVLGIVFGVILHYLGSRINRRKIMFAISVLLILMASALAAKAAWCFEHYKWSEYLPPDGDEGPSIQFNLKKVIWALRCCDPRTNDNLWGIAQIFLGWNNVAYVSTALAYLFYWVIVVGLVFYIRVYNKKQQNKTSTEKELIDWERTQGSVGQEVED